MSVNLWKDFEINLSWLIVFNFLLKSESGFAFVEKIAGMKYTAVIGELKTDF